MFAKLIRLACYRGSSDPSGPRSQLGSPKGLWVSRPWGLLECLVEGVSWGLLGGLSEVFLASPRPQRDPPWRPPDPTRHHRGEPRGDLWETPVPSRDRGPEDPLLGRNQKGQTKWDKPVSAKISGFLRFSAKICASEML